MEAKSWERGELECGAPFWWRAAPEGDVPEIRLHPPHVPLRWLQGRTEAGDQYWWRPAESGEPEVLFDESAQVRAEAGARAQSEQAAQRSTIDTEQKREQDSVYATRADLFQRDARLVSDMAQLEETAEGVAGDLGRECAAGEPHACSRGGSNQTRSERGPSRRRWATSRRRPFRGVHVAIFARFCQHGNVSCGTR